MTGGGIPLDSFAKRFILVLIVATVVVWIAIAVIVLITQDVFSPEPEVDVTSEQFGPFWPLTVERGEVGCNVPEGTRDRINPDRVFVFIHGGTTYALNELAEQAGYPSIEPIRKDSGAPGFKMSLEPLRSLAREKCRK